MSGEIVRESHYGLLFALEKLESDSEDDINFFINSHGGLFYVASDMHHALRNSNSHINTIGYRKLRSSAAIILQGGDNRFMDKKCKLEFHKTYIEADKNNFYNSSQLHELSLRLAQTDALQIYIHTIHGESYEKVYKLLQSEAVVEPKKAIRMKLIDGIWKKPISKP